MPEFSPTLLTISQRDNREDYLAERTLLYARTIRARGGHAFLGRSSTWSFFWIAVIVTFTVIQFASDRNIPSRVWSPIYKLKALLNLLLVSMNLEQ